MEEDRAQEVTPVVPGMLKHDVCTKNGLSCFYTEGPSTACFVNIVTLLNCLLHFFFLIP